MMRVLILAIVFAACGNDPTSLRVEAAVPAYAPITGGTSIRITGTGFVGDQAGPNRVLIAGREAPLARTIDDTTLEVVLPPGEQAGDAEVVVLNDNDNARATGILRYSAAPTIESAAPGDVVFTSSDTLVTLTGTGFLDEGAGDVQVIVDGQLATDVSVASDTSLTFTAPPGPALVRPDIELIDARGTATLASAFRYTPSASSGLLLFSAEGVEFALFFDPADDTTVPIPRSTGPSRFTAVVRDERGEYWGADRARRIGPIDWRTQRLATASPLQTWLPALVRVGTQYIGVNRQTLRLGSVDLASGGFSQIGTAGLTCCGSYGLAYDGTTLYYVESPFNGPIIAPIDPITGVPGASVPITAPVGFHVEDMRFFRGVLYVASRDGVLYTLDPVTGQATARAALGRFNAIEVFD